MHVLCNIVIFLGRFLIEFWWKKVMIKTSETSSHRGNLCPQEKILCKSVLEGLPEIQCDCLPVHWRTLSIPDQSAKGKKMSNL